MVIRARQGDAGILKQKLARDVVTRTATSPAALATAAIGALPSSETLLGPLGLGAAARFGERYNQALLRLTARMAVARGPASVASWMAQHADVETVAWGHCVQTVRRVVARGACANALELRSFDRYYCSGL